MSKRVSDPIDLTLSLYQYKDEIWTNYIGNRCIIEARRDSYDGLTNQTGICLQELNIQHIWGA